MNGNLIEKVSNFKSSGLEIDERMTWDARIASIQRQPKLLAFEEVKIVCPTSCSHHDI
jgi:hypothetical protein